MLLISNNVILVMLFGCNSLHDNSYAITHDTITIICGALVLTSAAFCRRMPLFPRLYMKKSRQYNVVSKDLMVIRVELLDSTPVECTLSSESSGQECLDNVCQRFGIKQVGAGTGRGGGGGGTAGLGFSRYWLG